MNYQISPDQNTITTNGKKYEFEDKNIIITCDGCAFNNEAMDNICNLAPCYPARRYDCKNGIFKLIQ